MIKRIFFFVSIWLSFFSAYAQKQCNEDSIMNIIGKWKKDPDANIQHVKNVPLMKKRVEAISKMFQEAYPKPTGTSAEWYMNMSAQPMVDAGPQAYSYNSLHHYWYCNENVNKLMLTGETGIWGHVWANEAGRFIWAQNDVFKVKVEGNDIFLLPKPAGQWKGYPLYEDMSENFGERLIILMHNNKLPWKAITQDQYLNALKADWQHQKKKSAEGNEEVIAQLKTTIKEWQNNKDIKPSDKEKIISELQKGLEEYKSNQKLQIEKTDKYWNDKIAIIDEYVKQNTSVLKQHAFINFQKYGKDDFDGTFSDEKEGKMLVTFDAAYFNKTLPDYIPQLMVLCWRWEKNTPGIFYKKQIEENFPIEKLKAMIDK